MLYQLQYLWLTAVVLNDGMGEKKIGMRRQGTVYTQAGLSTIRLFTVSTSEKHNRRKKKNLAQKPRNLSSKMRSSRGLHGQPPWNATQEAPEVFTKPWQHSISRLGSAQLWPSGPHPLYTLKSSTRSPRNSLSWWTVKVRHSKRENI